MRETAAALREAGEPALGVIGKRLADSLDHLEAATRSLLRKMAHPDGAGLAVAEPFLKLFGTTLGGWQMGKAAVVAATALARGSADPYYGWKIAAAGFYADHLLPKTGGLLITIESDNQALLDLPDEAF